MRCPTTAGTYQCQYDVGHVGPCEARDGDSKPSIRPRVADPAALRCPTCDQPMPVVTK